MMLLSVLLGIAMHLPGQQARVQSSPATQLPLKVGWSDEMNGRGWKSLNGGSKVRSDHPERGLLQLSLPHVPADWPYQYQWGGVTRDMDVNVGLYPVVAGRVVEVQGYAHLDIEALNPSGKVVKGIRSSTITHSGLVTADLSTILDPAKYRLRVRLIVGGPNEGCRATYTWLRFLKKEDLAFVSEHPDFQKIAIDRRR